MGGGREGGRAPPTPCPSLPSWTTQKLSQPKVLTESGLRSPLPCKVPPMEVGLPFRDFTYPRPAAGPTVAGKGPRRRPGLDHSRAVGGRRNPAQPLSPAPSLSSPASLGQPHQRPEERSLWRVYTASLQGRGVWKRAECGSGGGGKLWGLPLPPGGPLCSTLPQTPAPVSPGLSAMYS